MTKLASLVVSAVLMAGVPLAADTVYLKSGASYTGHVMGDRDTRITFQDMQGVQYQFPMRDVQSLSFSREGDTVTLRTGRTYTGQLTGPQNNTIRFVDRQGISYEFPTYSIASIEFAPGWQGGYASTGTGLVLPAGTEISVMSNQPIDSRNAQPGQTFRASITQDVMGPDGQVIIPRNSDATLLLRNESAGGIHSGDVVLDLDSVMIRGIRHSVATSDVVETNGQGVGKNRRTGEYVGGGAALGALLGAIAGGGRGAAIGAAAGAGAGAMGEVVTHGRYVYVPAETTLTFELSQPLVLRPYQDRDRDRDRDRDHDRN